MASDTAGMQHAQPGVASRSMIGMADRRTLVLLVFASLTVFLVGLRLYTLHNDSPYYLYFDEGFKTYAIYHEQPRFLQPRLLIGLTETVSSTLGLDQNRQQIVEVGRTLSATFAVSAVIVMMILAHLHYGLRAAIAVGVVLLCSHRLLLSAHYMKEDTALLFGASLVFLTMTLYWRRPSARTLLALGAACGLAISSKYVGVLLLLVALFCVRQKQRQQARDRDEKTSQLATCGWLFVGLLIPLGVLHARVLLHPVTFIQDVAYEFRHPLKGQGGVRAPMFLFSPYWRMFIWFITPGVALLAAYYLLPAIAKWREKELPEQLTIGVPLLYFAVLLSVMIVAPRYLLPVVVAIHYFAGLGAAKLVEQLPKRWLPRAALTAVLAAVIILPFAHITRGYYAELHTDTRERLRGWIAQHLPADAVIAQSIRVGLPDADEPTYFEHADGYLPQTLHSTKWVVNQGTVDGLVAKGVDYVAVCEPNYMRYLGNAQPLGDETAWFTRYRKRYQELFRRSELVCVFQPQTELHVGDNTSPVVKLYRLPGESSVTSQFSAQH